MRRRLWAAAVAAGLAGLTGVAGAGWWLSRGQPTTVRASISKTSVVLLGDSITEYGDWDDLLAGRSVANRGYAGYTTEELVPVADEVAADGPRLVLVLSGTNDIRDGHGPEWTIHWLEKVIAQLAANPDTRIVLQTVLPRADAPAEVAAVNEAIVELAAAKELTVLDLYPDFDDGRGGLRADETTDGLHLSAAGYDRWAAILDRFLDRESGEIEVGPVSSP